MADPALALNEDNLMPLDEEEKKTKAAEAPPSALALDMPQPPANLSVSDDEVMPLGTSPSPSMSVGTQSQQSPPQAAPLPPMVDGFERLYQWQSSLKNATTDQLRQAGFSPLSADEQKKFEGTALGQRMKDSRMIQTEANHHLRPSDQAQYGRGASTDYVRGPDGRVYYREVGSPGQFGSQPDQGPIASASPSPNGGPSVTPGQKIDQKTAAQLIKRLMQHPDDPRANEARAFLRANGYTVNF